MPGASSFQDVVLLVLILSVLGSGAIATWIAGQLQPRRPALPAADCPPAGLGRLVPSGRQVDLECRRGLLALEDWLRAHRP